MVIYILAKEEKTILFSHSVAKTEIQFLGVGWLEIEYNTQIRYKIAYESNLRTKNVVNDSISNNAVAQL